MDLSQTKVSGALVDFPDHHLIFGGDLNCDVRENNALSQMIRDFMNLHNLEFCDNKIAINERTTYHHVTMDSNSYIDYLFVSRDILPDLIDYSILDYAFNMQGRIYHYAHYARA